jgi:hypothetical protein
MEPFLLHLETTRIIFLAGGGLLKGRQAWHRQLDVLHQLVGHDTAVQPYAQPQQGLRAHLKVREDMSFVIAWGVTESMTESIGRTEEALVCDGPQNGI